jgi:hypothetical protein
MLSRHRSLMFALMTVVAVALMLGARSMAKGALAAEQSEQMDASERGALDPLTPDEESAAERIARSDHRVKEIFGEREVRLVSATPVLIKRGEALEKIDVHQRVIEVVLFSPEPEVGARVLVNLAQNSAANVERLDSRQVPFTPDDLKDAFQLALREPQVQKALGSEAQSFHVQGQRNEPPATASENLVSGLPIRSSDPKDPCSKHRCLQLFFRRGTDFLSEPVVTVDLTAKHVFVERRKSK